MLTGMVIWRDFSTGRAGISPRISNGPNIPLVVQYSFCANAPDDAAMHSRPSNAATMPDFFIVFNSSIGILVVVLLLLLPTCTPLISFSPTYGQEAFAPSLALRWLRYGAMAVCLNRFQGVNVYCGYGSRMSMCNAVN